MKKCSFLPKLVFCAIILTSASSLASEPASDNLNETDTLSLKQVVEEDYAEHYVNYRQKAITYAESLPAPQLADGIFGSYQNVGGWASAIANYKEIMHLNPLPSEEKWPIRGFVKQYNLHLITVTENHIQQQKDALLKELEGQ